MKQFGLFPGFLLKITQQFYIAEIYLPVTPEIKKVYGYGNDKRKKSVKKGRVNKLHNKISALMVCKFSNSAAKWQRTVKRKLLFIYRR